MAVHTGVLLQNAGAIFGTIFVAIFSVLNQAPLFRNEYRMNKSSSKRKQCCKIEK